MIFLIYYIFIHRIWERNLRDLLHIKKGRGDRQSSEKFFKTFSIASPLFFKHKFRVGSVRPGHGVDRGPGAVDAQRDAMYKGTPSMRPT